MTKHLKKSRRRKGGSLAPLGYGQVDYQNSSGASQHVLKTYGNGEQQFNNALGSKSQPHSNALQLLGGRRRTKRHHKKRGGFAGNVVQQAIVPLTLFGLQQRFKKRSNNSSKTRKRFRK
jgi:hypothetical protein